MVKISATMCSARYPIYLVDNFEGVDKMFDRFDDSTHLSLSQPQHV